MNDLDLEKKLKAARVPARDEDYWESFPRQVSAKLRTASAEHAAAERPWLPRLAWSGGIAFACLVIGFAIGHWHGRMENSDPYALLQNEKALREVLTLFPNRVRAIVQDGRGVQLVLSDHADVPVSTPIYVRIRAGKQCSALVTFSGQELEIAGQKVTILADAQGGVIVTGLQFAWSSDRPGGGSDGLKIEARSLSSINL
jgi:hypothetical protein